MTAVEARVSENGAGRGWNLCRRLWGEQVSTQSHRSMSAQASSTEESPRDHHQQNHLQLHHHHHHQYHHRQDSDDGPFVKAVTKALLHRRRLSFEPDKKLYFPYEPGKRATSAVRIKNVSRSQIAFKFQTTAPKSCFMRPPNGVLSPGESIVATVVKLIQQPERAHRNQARDKFKIISLKMVEGVEFTPEMFDEQKGLVAVEQILRVHFLDPENPTTELENLKKRIAEADAANEACKKPLSEKGPVQIVGEGNILEEWNKMKLARHLVKEDSE